MSEAVAAVLRFGFEQMALHRVEATVLTGNTASAALLGRAGPTGLPPSHRLIRRPREAGNP
jgi:RimJ/RimL family protein N-acetyltransferase